MDPHPTPFAGKRRPVPAAAAAAAKAAAPKSKSIAGAPKPKSIAAARAARIAKRSPSGNGSDAPQPRPTRRAFGAVRSSNAPVEKPPPKGQKPSKVLPPPPPQKPAKVSPPPLQKHFKLSPPAFAKPSKLSPPNPARATKLPRPVAKPLKKTATGADLEANAKKRSQRVSFQVAAVELAALGSREKGKAIADDAAGRTPMVSMKAAEKRARVVGAETPFFSAQNCSSCTLDQLESAAYWLAHIRIAESAGKHSVAAAFFRLAFECQAQPIHRLQSELRNYSVRHESAGTLAPLFDELLTAHGMLVNQPKFDTDGFEKVDTPLATNVVDKKLDFATLKEDDCIDGPADVGAVIVDKHEVENVEYPTFERKLDESFEFDDSEAVIVDGSEATNLDLQNNTNVDMEVPFSSGIAQSQCRFSIEKLGPRESSGLFSLDKPLNKLSTSMRISSATRLSSGGSPYDKRSPLSSKRLTASCPSRQKSVSVIDQSSKRMSSGIHSSGELNANAGADEHQSIVNQDMGSKPPSLVDQFEFEAIETAEDAANNEVH